MDGRYDTGAVHRGLKLLEITRCLLVVCFSNDASEYEFDTFICPMGRPFVYHRLNRNMATGKYLQCYQVQEGDDVFLVRLVAGCAQKNFGQ